MASQNGVKNAALAAKNAKKAGAAAPARAHVQSRPEWPAVKIP
jgi:hypothetical protein